MRSTASIFGCRCTVLDISNDVSSDCSTALTVSTVRGVVTVAVVVANGVATVTVVAMTLSISAESRAGVAGGGGERFRVGTNCNLGLVLTESVILSIVTEVLDSVVGSL